MKFFAAFSMVFAFAMGCVAEQGESPELGLDEAAVSVEAKPDPSGPVINGPCEVAWAACTADCQDLIGAARAACLRICRAEYEDCL